MGRKTANFRDHLVFDEWREFRSLGSRGLKRILIGILFISLAIPLSLLLAVSRGIIRPVPIVGITVTVVVFALYLYIPMRKLKGPESYVTMIAYVFDEKRKKIKIEDFIIKFLKREDSPYMTKETREIHEFRTEGYSAIIFKSAYPDRARGIALKDRSGGNMDVLQRFYRKATRKFTLSPDVLNARRIKPIKRKGGD